MADKKSAFDKDLVSDLARILNETDLTEIEVEQGEMRIRVSREAPAQFVSHMAPSAPPAAPPAAAAPQPAAESAEPAAGAAPQAPSTENALPAPMVGTAYLAPAPGAEPFIAVGASVAEGETLLIIEAMKVMNQIPAPRAGTVTAILIEDGEPVEFGQPLLVIE
ncbi:MULTISPECIES: acetyl-CoA carboxylase biotin carboxyl carrier protein [unclassified Roseitalea]|uniref:acetyl-CoA carboxylase biotin carboxyl carrier protein n=1 Tax=unclassified Roseitalea TaxID=2639107 RepID=UPI00273E72DE|nr:MULTISPECIES: acetyl-CoA carboxylase biotin carboxyl carrier protein [unclassified Roseitalea]